MSSYSTSYNPDVLSTLANLSSDEVFTPPHIANQMLDLLPQELFSNKNTTFLDPATKSGVFLREITKRLIKGLENEIPNLQERIDHILHNQVFGIAITELTALLSRRTLYCSKYPNSRLSISHFSSKIGNIKFEFLKHTWEGGKCIYCGGNQKEFDKTDSQEAHAYSFIHQNANEELKDMKFDVIIGNPPYQLSDGGAQSSAIPIYHKFVTQAKKLNPRFITMIIPSRWFAGGKGLDEFRKEMLNDKSIRIIHDYLSASDCFPNVEIKGGVNYFLWNRDNKGDCEVNTHKGNNIISTSVRALIEDGNDIFVRYNEAVAILKKVSRLNEKKFSDIVSPRKPFDISTNFNEFKTDNSDSAYKIYANQKTGFIDKKFVESNNKYLKPWKLFIPYAIGSGDINSDWVKPLIGEPYSVSTETYLVVGLFKSKEVAENAFSYTQTKFFHFLLSLRKITQHTTSKVYSFIPMQDFSYTWNDKILYEKYGFSASEIQFIENMIGQFD